PTIVIPSINITQPTDVSIVYEANAVGPNFLQTYATSLNNKTTQTLDIGYTFGDNDDPLKPGHYDFSTTQHGKYLVRRAQSTLEIAPSNNPTAFKKVITCACDLYDYIFSSDETHIAYLAKYSVSNYSVYITDLDGKNFKIKFPTSVGDSPLVAFD